MQTEPLHLFFFVFTSLTFLKRIPDVLVLLNTLKILPDFGEVLIKLTALTI